MSRFDKIMGTLLALFIFGGLATFVALISYEVGKADKFEDRCAKVGGAVIVAKRAAYCLRRDIFIGGIE